MTHSLTVSQKSVLTICTIGAGLALAYVGATLTYVRYILGDR